MPTSFTTETPATGAAVPFQPNPFQLNQMPLFGQNDVPRYLFRVYAPSTAGETTDSYVTPPASTCGRAEKTRDIFRLPPAEAATRLNEHLRWWPSHESMCTLMSWTSSLLFALQHGLRRHKTDDDKPELSEISLLILDTRSFPPGTFIKDMEIMEVFAPCDFNQTKNLDAFLQLRKSDRGYYFGEYLTQGKIDIIGRCIVTNMQRLIDAGLFELKPELKDNSRWGELANRVIELRKLFKASQDTPTATHAEVRQAITIAGACFGNGWDIPVAIMFLALQRRQRKDRVIINGFAAMFAEKEIECLQMKDIKSDAHRLPELEQFQRLIDDISQHFMGKDIKSLPSPFDNLSLGQS